MDEDKGRLRICMGRHIGFEPGDGISFAPICTSAIGCGECGVITT